MPKSPQTRRAAKTARTLKIDQPQLSLKSWSSFRNLKHNPFSQGLGLKLSLNQELYRLPQKLQSSSWTIRSTRCKRRSRRRFWSHTRSFTSFRTGIMSLEICIGSLTEKKMIFTLEKMMTRNTKTNHQPKIYCNRVTLSRGMLSLRKEKGLRSTKVVLSYST